MSKFCHDCRHKVIPTGIPESNYDHWECGYRTLLNPVNGSEYHPRCVMERAFKPTTDYQPWCGEHGVNWKPVIIENVYTPMPRRKEAEHERS